MSERRIKPLASLIALEQAARAIRAVEREVRDEPALARSMEALKVALATFAQHLQSVVSNR